MRAVSALLMTLLVSSCLQFGKHGEDGTGADAGNAGSTGSAGAATTTGTNCGVDPSSGVALCLGISSCPSVRVDPDQFPDCGYRISGNRIDLECLCGDSLCPMGKAASCRDAQGLLSEQSAQAVCAGVADGLCQVVQQAQRSGKSSCDQECRAQCSGVPGCLSLCGC